MIEFGNLAVQYDPTGDLLEMFREEAHQAVDDLIDKLAPHLTGRRMSLSDIFQEKRSELLGQLIEGFIKAHHLDLFEQDLAQCPRCGRYSRVRQKRAREVETIHGTVGLQRPYF